MAVSTMIKIGGAVASSFTSATQIVKGGFLKIGDSIRDVKKKQEQLTSSPAMKNVGDTFVKTGQQAKHMASSVWGAASAFASVITKANAQTAEQVRLAKVLGVSGEAFGAWGGLANEAGCKANTVGDLMKKMNTNLGKPLKLGDNSAVTNSLKTIGLSFKDLENLSPEQKFKTVASAIKNLDDAQAAQSAANTLMGGDSGKLFSFLRSRKESVDELLDQQNKLNVLSDEGREGSLVYAQAMGRVSGVLSNATAEFSGLIGGALAPYIQEIGPRIAALFEEHRDDIKAFGAGLGEALPKIGEFAFGMLNVLSNVGSMIAWVADAVGGFGNVAAIVGGIMGAKFVYSGISMVQTMWSVGQAIAPIVSSVFPALIGGIRAVGLAVMANPIGAAIGLAVIAVGRLIFMWDELCKAFKSGGVLGALGKFFGVGGDDEEKEKKTAPSIPAKSPKTSSVGSAYAQSQPVQQQAVSKGTLPEGLPTSQKVRPADNVYTQPVPLNKVPLSSSASVESKQITDNRNVTINVYGAEGQNSHEIGEVVHAKFNDDSAALYDHAYA
ncbi:phage tail tape measure protein [Halodesulfovibrio aestuarii]|uniref:Phage-related minor tail protein n=1 Tax=Halodesulfovibrio aestuarii TaxID=126333 RepID=A0A8G2F8J0_9BACT|nr:phage tail tape measure protein [Halodesulfovibrio aestuarii]SHI81971.1 Phage-related minor tail protein [Halodesulfovibrio aestuarii]